MDATAIIEPLSSTERYELHGHEQTIERGLGTFQEVGTALLAIRDKRLYRSTHANYDAYLEERWGISRRRADQLISAAEVVDNLLRGLGTNGSQSVTTPANERQARELAALDPETQIVVWRSILNGAPDGKVTAGHIKSVASAYEELVTTGAIDPGDGEMIAASEILTARITEETRERMLRQQEHIRESLDKKAGGNGDGSALAAADAQGANGNHKPKTNRPGDENEAKKYDACQTPAYAIGPLLQYLAPDLLIWESAQGEGLLVEALHDNGFRVTGSDIVTGHNFFNWQPEHWAIQVTNPPYSIKYKWLARSYALGLPFALLLPVETLGAATGQALFKQHGVQVIFLDQRVNFKMPNTGWDGKGAQFPVAWFTWGLGLPSDMVFGQLYKGGQK